MMAKRKAYEDEWHAVGPEESSKELVALEARKSRARRILDGVPVKPIEMLEPGEKIRVRVMVENPRVQQQRPLTRAQKKLVSRGYDMTEHSPRPLTPTQIREADHERLGALERATFEVDKLYVRLTAINRSRCRRPPRKPNRHSRKDTRPVAANLKRERNGPPPGAAQDRENKLESLNELLSTRGPLFDRAVEQFKIDLVLVEEGMAVLNDPAKYSAYQELCSALIEEDAELILVRARVAGTRVLRANAASLAADARDPLPNERRKAYLAIHGEQSGRQRTKDALAAFRKRYDSDDMKPEDRMKTPSARHARRWQQEDKKAKDRGDAHSPARTHVQSDPRRRKS
jgi:hypothetical protein